MSTRFVVTRASWLGVLVVAVQASGACSVFGPNLDGFADGTSLVGGGASPAGASSGGAASSNGAGSAGLGSGGASADGGASPDGGAPDGGAPNGGAPNGGAPHGGAPHGGAPHGGATSQGGTSANGGSSGGVAGTSSQGGTSGSPVEVADPAFVYMIKNRATAMVTDVWGTSLTSGARVAQFPENGAPNQMWQFTKGTGDGYVLLNFNSGLALETSRAAAEQDTPNGSSAQSWTLQAATKGYDTLVSGVGNGVLTSPSFTVGDTLTIAAPNGSGSQEWQLVPVAKLNTPCILKNQATGMVADVLGGSSSSGASVVQWSASGASNQHWRFASSAGGIAFYSYSTGLALDSNNGAVDQAPFGGSAQKWSVSEASAGYFSIGTSTGVLTSPSSNQGDQLRVSSGTNSASQRWQISCL